MQAEGQELAAWARMLADGTRATVCLALLDGRAWTATELARVAQVSRPTISEHLNLLVEGGLLTEVRQGRHRYVKLAGPDTAELIEDSPRSHHGVRRSRTACPRSANETRSREPGPATTTWPASSAWRSRMR